jgi:uncharacterized protein (DUF305 family)
MKHCIGRWALSTSAVIATGVLASSLWWGAEAAEPQKGTTPQAHGATHGQHGAASGPSGELHQTMMKGMQEMEAMKMTGDVDHDFIMMMKMHHEDGIRMAQVQLKNGKDPESRRMAEKIVAEQQKDIEEFNRWLSKHGHSAGE